MSNHKVRLFDLAHGAGFMTGLCLWELWNNWELKIPRLMSGNFFIK